jgi:hypothetical protein
MTAEEVPARSPRDAREQEAATVSPAVPPELLRGLCTADAELLGRQGTAASPFTRWTQATRTRPLLRLARSRLPARALALHWPAVRDTCWYGTLRRPSDDACHRQEFVKRILTKWIESK